jgi:hypothetical protein
MQFMTTGTLKNLPGYMREDNQLNFAPVKYKDKKGDLRKNTSGTGTGEK